MGEQKITVAYGTNSNQCYLIVGGNNSVLFGYFLRDSLIKSGFLEFQDITVESGHKDMDYFLGQEPNGQLTFFQRDNTPNGIKLAERATISYIQISGFSAFKLRREKGKQYLDFLTDVEIRCVVSQAIKKIEEYGSRLARRGGFLTPLARKGFGIYFSRYNDWSDETKKAELFGEFERIVNNTVSQIGIELSGVQKRLEVYGFLKESAKALFNSWYQDTKARMSKSADNIKEEVKNQAIAVLIERYSLLTQAAYSSLRTASSLDVVLMDDLKPLSASVSDGFRKYEESYEAASRAIEACDKKEIAIQTKEKLDSHLLADIRGLGVIKPRMIRKKRERKRLVEEYKAAVARIDDYPNKEELRELNEVRNRKLTSTTSNGYAILLLSLRDRFIEHLNRDSGKVDIVEIPSVREKAVELERKRLELMDKADKLQDRINILWLGY